MPTQKNACHQMDFGIPLLVGGLIYSKMSTIQRRATLVQANLR